VRYHDFVMDSSRWDGFAIRDGDIIISTPAKCGTTWTQRLCSLLLGVEPTPDRPLAAISPWLEMLVRPRESVVADLEAQQHRRFIKSHTPLDGLPWDDRITYIAVARDPRDVALSWAHHFDNIDFDRFLTLRLEAVGADDLAEVMPDGPPPPPPSDPAERFWEWVDGAAMGGNLEKTLRHLQSFWDVRDRPNVHLFHYGDMQADLPANVRRLASALGVEVDESEVARIAEAAAFGRMRADASTVAPNTDTAFWRDTTGFFHRGTSGQWRDLIDAEGLVGYDAAVAAFVPPDLAHWVHEGGIIPGRAKAAPAG